MKKLVASFLIFVLVLPSFTQATAATPKNTLKLSNGTLLQTWFYPYRDPTSNMKPDDVRSLQGFTFNKKKEVFLSYTTGNKQKYGYIYKYNTSGKLLKKSKRLVMGHGQAISNYNSTLYVVADIVGNASYKLYSMSDTTLRVKKSWTLQSNIHPNVLYMHSDTVGSVVSKVADSYYINRIQLTKNGVKMDYKDRIIVKGLVGKTPRKPIQGFTYYKGTYYILSDGQYVSFDKEGKNIKRVNLQTVREPEGIGFINGKMVLSFNKPNELFKQK